MESEIIRLISVGGDLSTMALIAIFWKMDKRITYLEWRAKNIDALKK